jgi:hypothetical protein
MILAEAQRQHDERSWRAESIDAEIGWKNLADG